MKETLYGLAKTGKILEWVVETDGDTIIVTHGQLGGKMQTRKTVCKPKNVGKANETTPEEQAVSEAWSKYNKQMDKCYCKTQEEAICVGNRLPMLAHDYTKQGHRIKFPCYVSTKLDGVRCIADVIGQEVVLTSRGGKTYPCPDFLSQDLITLSMKTGFTKFDGELYIHGLSLQNIVSCVKKPNENTPNIKFCIFDVPSNKTWEGRYEDLKSLEGKARLDSIKLVMNVLVHSEKDAEFFLDKYIKDGYEGIMLRNISGKYEFNHRSADIQKWKRMKDSEALVMYVTEDKNGEGVLTCQMKEDKNKTFDCKMVGDAESRSVENQRKLIGKWISYKYQTLTDAGIPQFPVGLCERNCDINGEPLE